MRETVGDLLTTTDHTIDLVALYDSVTVYATSLIPFARERSILSLRNFVKAGAQVSSAGNSGSVSRRAADWEVTALTGSSPHHLVRDLLGHHADFPTVRVEVIAPEAALIIQHDKDDPTLVALG